MCSRDSVSNAHQSQTGLAGSDAAARHFSQSAALSRSRLTRWNLRVELARPRQQLRLGRVLFVDRDTADDAFSQIRVMALEFGEQLNHGTARTGSWAEQQDLLGAP